MAVKKDNHFVPRMYLKNWATNGKVEVYRVLVQHEKVPMWKPFYLNGIGYLKHLYVNTQDGKECDSLETWFDEKYESPAEESIAKVVSNSKLTPNDYTNLINFFALQDLRTPKKFIEHLSRNDSDEFEKLFKGVVDKVMAKGIPASFEPSGDIRYHDSLPLKLNITKEEQGLAVYVEKLIGRASWLWSIKHLLNNITEHLHEHKWTILHPAKGMAWYTSDNPTLKLNFGSSKEQIFKGGWGNEGTELMLPLSPQHLLYTFVGRDHPLPRGTRVSIEKTEQLNQFIVENSHRYVISDVPNPEITKIHKRLVSSDEVKYEREQWESLHQ